MSKTYEYATLEKKYNDLKRDFDYQHTIIQELMDKYSNDGKLKNLDICIELYYNQQKTFTVEEVKDKINQTFNKDFIDKQQVNMFRLELLAEFEKEVE